MDHASIFYTFRYKFLLLAEVSDKRSIYSQQIPTTGHSANIWYFVLLIPVQVWIERVSHAQFDGTFIEFYPHYFEGFYAFGGNFAWMDLHLWYLEILFICTLLTFPFFILPKKARGQEIISGAATFFEKTGSILLLGIPLFIMELLVNLQPEGVGVRDFGGWSLFSYLIVFVTGFLIAFDLRYREAMERSRFISLAVGLLTTSLMFFFPIDLAPPLEISLNLV